MSKTTQQIIQDVYNKHPAIIQYFKLQPKKIINSKCHYCDSIGTELKDLSNNPLKSIEVLVCDEHLHDSPYQTLILSQADLFAQEERNSLRNFVAEMRRINDLYNR